MQLGQSENSTNPSVAQASAQYQAALTQLATARSSQAITVAQEQVNLQKTTLEAAQSASTAVIEQQVGQTAMALNSAKAVQPAAAAIAEAQLAQAQQTVLNAQATAALDVIAAQRRQGLVNVQILQDQLKDGLLLSPAEGMVAAVLVPAGQNTTAQTPVISIVSTTPVFANINVPEQEIAGLQAGSRMSLHIPAIPFTGPAAISGIKPGIDTSTKTYTVVLELEQPDAGIWPGMFVQAMPEETSAQSITVPANAVLKQTDGTYAVYIVQENRAVKRTVKLGTLTGSRYEITAGLDSGEQLIVKGQTFVSDNTLVQVVKGAGDRPQTEVQP
ncbi:Solvent efflux pump periplasmic linker SrpA precursor [compost metagenome]